MDTSTMKELRHSLKTQRDSLSEADKQAMDNVLRSMLYDYLMHIESLCTQTPLVIAGFWPIGHEPDLRPLLTKLNKQKNISIVLPVVREKNAPLDFRVWKTEETLKKGAYQILEPTGEQRIPNIFLVPTLGYTHRGERIGYGGGYYDRTLQQQRASIYPTLAIGVSYHCGLITDQTYRAQAHDEPLDAVITDQGWEKSIPDDELIKKLVKSQ